jgi:hypothetical protein
MAKRLRSLFIRVLEAMPGVPRHRVWVEIAGRTFCAWRYTPLDSQTAEPRELLVLDDGAVRALGDAAVKEWSRFTKKITEAKRDRNFNSVPILKVIVNEEGADLLAGFTWRKVVHHFGVVPVVVLGESAEFEIVALPGLLGHEPRPEARDDERRVVLSSYDRYLPAMVPVYGQRLAWWLEALIGAPRSQVMDILRYVRHIATASIRNKRRDIEECLPSLVESYAVAQRIQSDHPSEVAELRALDAFGHFIINTLCPRFNIKDRTDHYQRALEAIETPHGNESIDCLKRLADHFRQPDHEFIEALSEGRITADRWLRELARPIRFLAEVARVSREHGTNTLSLFLSRHLRVVSSDRFDDAVGAACQTFGQHLTLIRARNLTEGVEHTMLARIFFADAQMFYLPSDWSTHDGSDRQLNTRFDWVVTELIYGQIINKPLVLVREAPVDDKAMERFVEQIRRHPLKVDVDRLLGCAGEGAVARAKEKLIKRLGNEPYLKYDPQVDLAADPRVHDRFQELVFAPQALRRIESAFRGWRDSCDPKRWSIVQALLDMQWTKDFLTLADTDRVVGYIEEHRQERRYGWTNGRSEARIRKAVSEALNGPMALQFELGGRVYAPVVVRRIGPKVGFEVPVREVHRAFCTHFLIDEATAQAHFADRIRPILERAPGSG